MLSYYALCSKKSINPSHNVDYTNHEKYNKMRKINLKQQKQLVEGVKKMFKSKEQFIFMMFKNDDGSDNIIQYSWNTTPEKLVYYFQEAIKSRIMKEEVKKK